jgi:hypothetical protein
MVQVECPRWARTMSFYNQDRFRRPRNLGRRQSASPGGTVQEKSNPNVWRIVMSAKGSGRCFDSSGAARFRSLKLQESASGVNLYPWPNTTRNNDASFEIVLP